MAALNKPNYQTRQQLNCLEVRVGEDLEKAIRALKKKMAQEGLYKELKKRRFYEKPSVRRKRKSDEAERRRRKNANR